MNMNIQKTCRSTNLLRNLPTIILAIIAFLAITGMVSCAESKRISKTAEAIKSATHIEIEPNFNFLQSLLLAQPVSLSLQTTQRMDLPKNITITDVNKIEQFAKLIQTSGYRKKWFDYPDSRSSMTVRFFQGSHVIGSFRMNGVCLHIPAYGTFQAVRPLEDLQRELRAILSCDELIKNIIRRESDINSIGFELFLITEKLGTVSIIKDKWCNYFEQYISTFVERERSKWNDIDPEYKEYVDMLDMEATIKDAHIYKTRLERIMSLDSPGPPQCPYALNSQYQEDSPEDTVVIFETEPGWNKSGGPELLSSCFTDPNGCFLYLKDNEVEFITNSQIERIKEEAQRLALRGRPLEFRFSTLLKIIEPEKMKEQE